jgi:hypothetical protein
MPQQRKVFNEEVSIMYDASSGALTRRRTIAGIGLRQEYLLMRRAKEKLYDHPSADALFVA